MKEQMLALLNGVKTMMEQQGKTDNDDYRELCAEIAQIEKSEIVIDGEDTEVSDS